jgi:hypothetical protein
VSGAPTRARRRWIAAAAIVAVIAGVAIGAVALSGGGGGGSTTLSGGSVTSATTRSLADAKLTVADMPSGYTVKNDGGAALPMATCAGAEPREASVVGEQIGAGFVKGPKDESGVQQYIIRYTTGAEDEYNHTARSIASCTSKAGQPGSFVGAAETMALPHVGDERSGATVKLVNPNHPNDPNDPPVYLAMAVVRKGDVVVQITASTSSGTIDPGFVEGLVRTTFDRLP